MPLNNIFALQSRDLLDMPKQDARLVLSARSWFLLRSVREDPLPRIANYLWSAKAALRFGLLMEVVQQCWPAPFVCHRICCNVVSMDEALLTQMLRHGSWDSRDRFDLLLKEMIDEDARSLLFIRASYFGRAYC